MVCCRIISAEDDNRPFHYSSFVGPVSGEAEEISVPRAVYPYPYQSSYERDNDMTVDYVAKPAYSFVYGVEDPEFGKSHKHEESRDGDVVQGEYSVLEPDGSIRRVVYTSDAKHGFRATVTNTPAKEGWQLPPQPPPLPKTKQPAPDYDHTSYPSYTEDTSTPSFSYGEYGSSEDPHEEYGDKHYDDDHMKYDTPRTTPTAIRKKYRY